MTSPIALGQSEDVVVRIERASLTRGLTYHVESFKLAPDGVPRLFVRAYWTAAGEARTGLTLWIRFDGRTFTVERADARVSELARFEEMFWPNVASNALAAGQLVAVVPDSDGWAFVVLANVGYESRSVVVWKYSPDGPVTTGVQYSTGC
jgi:hypothetical protein